MKISQIQMKDFKHFTDLSINGIPETAKLVVLVGPNGCGKSSLFDGLNAWHRATYDGAINNEYLGKGFPHSTPASQRSTISVNVVFHDYVSDSDRSLVMYFRTAYRHEPEFTVGLIDNNLLKINPYKISRLVDSDKTLSANCHRLLMKAMQRAMREDISTKDMLNPFLYKINESLTNIFDNGLIIGGLQHATSPTSGVTFKFSKGKVTSSPYVNLSAGERAVFDLILDLMTKIETYHNTVFVIDEPELHVHTDAQGRLIHEICKIIPDSSQLWVATHSLGIMQAAVEMDSKNPGSVACLDFSDHDFDTKIEMTPSRITRKLLDKFTSIALGNVKYFSLIPAKFFIVCEGHGRLSGDNSRSKKSIDSDAYSSIFGDEYNDMEFIAAEGGCEEVKRTVPIIRATAENAHVTGIVDRDDSSSRQSEEAKLEYIFHLPENRRNIESYLLDDEIIRKLGKQCNKNEDVIQSCLDEIKNAVSKNPIKGKSEHDKKSALGDIYLIIKRKLDPKSLGSNTYAFLRDTMAPLITPETEVYKEMKKCIITPIRESNKNIAKSE